MPSIAANVLVGTTGAVYIAPLGTVAPTTSLAVYIAAWKELGYLSEDGIVEEPAMDVEEIKVWQSGAIVRRVITGSGLQWTFTCVETRLDVITNFYPGPPTPPLSGHRSNRSLTSSCRSSSGSRWRSTSSTVPTIQRTIVPEPSSPDAVKVSMVNGSAHGYTFTMSAQPDSAGGQRHPLPQPAAGIAVGADNGAGRPRYSTSTRSQREATKEPFTFTSPGEDVHAPRP